MVKIALVKFESNLAFGIGGGKRENYKKGDKIIVGASDILNLRRLGCTIEKEIIVNYKEHKSLFVTPASTKAGKEKELVEAPAETKTEEVVEETAESK